jgi:predicted RNase H-like HicB family nuclease
MLQTIQLEDNEPPIFTAILHQEGHLTVAYCPEIGTVSQGETMKIALENLQEATELFLEEFPEEAKPNLDHHSSK